MPSTIICPYCNYVYSKATSRTHSTGHVQCARCHMTFGLLRGHGQYGTSQIQVAQKYQIIESYDFPYMAAPVPGAFQETVPVVDVRNVDTPDKLVFAEDWHSRGSNHRVHKGCICRDMGHETVWFVYIPDILTFIRLHGACTLSVDFFDQPQIQICAHCAD